MTQIFHFSLFFLKSAGLYLPFPFLFWSFFKQWSEVHHVTLSHRVCALNCLFPGDTKRSDCALWRVLSNALQTLQTVCLDESDNRRVHSFFACIAYLPLHLPLTQPFVCRVQTNILWPLRIAYSSKSCNPDRFCAVAQPAAAIQHLPSQWVLVVCHQSMTFQLQSKTVSGFHQWSCSFIIRCVPNYFTFMTCYMPLWEIRQQVLWTVCTSLLKWWPIISVTFLTEHGFGN